jgi:hypothetical protein
MTTPGASNDQLLLEWATPLFIVTFDGVDDLNRQLAQVVRRKEKEFAKRAKPAKHTPQYWSHFSAFHYRQDLFAWEDESIATLKLMITDAAQRFTSTYFGESGLVPTRIAGWANINRVGDWHGPHNHFSGDQCLSGVYWVQNGHQPSDVFDLDGSLVYMDPRGYGCPARHELVFGPQPGRMLLQPSWLAHTVTPKRSTGLRISIAFDIFFKRNPWWDTKARLCPTLGSR